MRSRNVRAHCVMLFRRLQRWTLFLLLVFCCMGSLSPDLLLAEGAQPDQRTRTGVTPLALAALDGDAAIIGHLLEAGADPNARTTGSGVTPLHLAASAGRLEVARPLVDMSLA